MLSLLPPAGYRHCDETALIDECAPVRGRRVLELGCGAARLTRHLAASGAARVVATEVDPIQHARNLDRAAPSVIQFRLGGAESIADPDASYDRVFMFKSLHHVPIPLMEPALREIHRVLVPDGLLYVAEPVYDGPFNDITRLIADEREVRLAAFRTLTDAVARGAFVLEHEIFQAAEGVYPDWPTFESRFVDATFHERPIASEQRARIRAAFERHLTPEGARFLKPHRIDVLRRAQPWH